MRKKKLLIGLFVLMLAVIALVIICDKTTRNAAKGKLYSDISSIPYNKVGLLLGTSKWIGDQHNLYYAYRIEAASALMRAGKIKYLIISGDNGRSDYNEPEMMRTDLISQGIDSSRIYLDYAGFRTFDSMIRLKEIFGQDSVTIISQKFHNERALYIAQREKISAIGYNAKDVTGSGGIKTKIREKLARVKMIMDFWFHTKPRYLGAKVEIPK